MRISELFEAGLTYRGYPCTKDCSGHQAGYNWAVAYGLDPDSCPYSTNSFWEGCISKDEPGPDVEESIVREAQPRANARENIRPDRSTLNDLKSKYLPDWEMLDHRILQAKYVAKDHRHAAKFTNWINRLSEHMDHFAEVTQDVAEVTVKTTTFDVKGLTILDFELAMRVDAFAGKHDIDQVRMSGNFGMHEEWSTKYKRSINCSNPQGFSQRAHCQGRKKK